MTRIARKFICASMYNRIRAAGEKDFGISLTKPNEAISIQRLLRDFTRNPNLVTQHDALNKEGMYYDEEVEMPVYTPDIEVVMAQREELQKYTETVKEQVYKDKKAKALKDKEKDKETEKEDE